MQRSLLCCLWCCKGRSGPGRVVWQQKCYLCGGKLPGIWVTQTRVSRRHLLLSTVFCPHLVPLKPSGLPREFLGSSITPLCSPCSTFLPDEGKGSSGKGTGRKGLLLSLPDAEVGCNKCMNLGSRKWKLKTTFGLVSLKSAQLCLFCK